MQTSPNTNHQGRATKARLRAKAAKADAAQEEHDLRLLDRWAEEREAEIYNAEHVANRLAGQWGWN